MQNSKIQNISSNQDQTSDFNALSTQQENLQVSHDEKARHQNEKIISKESLSQDNFIIGMAPEQTKKRGRKAKYDGAEYPDLIDKAKMILPEHNYDVTKILELKEFQPLKGSKDLTKFISKFILNKCCQSHAKSEKQKSICSKLSVKAPENFEQRNAFKISSFKKEDQFDQSNEELINQIANQGAKTQSEITSSYIIEFIRSTAEERQDLLWKIFSRNSQSLLEFLQTLKSAAPDQITLDLF